MARVRGNRLGDFPLGLGLGSRPKRTLLGYGTRYIHVFILRVVFVTNAQLSMYSLHIYLSLFSTWACLLIKPNQGGLSNKDASAFVKTTMLQLHLNQ